MSEGIERNGNEVHVLWCEHKLKAIYYRAADALADLKLLREKGYKDCCVSCVQVQNQTREPQHLDIQTIKALKQCVERS